MDCPAMHVILKQDLRAFQAAGTDLHTFKATDTYSCCMQEGSSAPDTVRIWVGGAGATILCVDRGFFDCFTLRPAEVVGTSCSLMVSEDDCSRFKE
jgi:hypothetical protein